MKKILFSVLMLGVVLLSSCKKTPVGGTATESLAGQWYVEVLGIDENGAVLYEDEDLYGLGFWHLLTYNTSENTEDSMWIQDVDGAFWDFKVKVGCDLANETFSINEGENQQYSPCKVTITNGKILKGAAKTPSGMPADSIVMDILYDDDPYAGMYYDRLRISGYRYTGLAADD